MFAHGLPEQFGVNLIYNLINYAKLPSRFKVPTPLATYNPDWAVLVKKDGAERLYFVVETKSTVKGGVKRDSSTHWMNRRRHFAEGACGYRR